MQTIYEWDFRNFEPDPQLILKRNIKEFEKSFEDTEFVQDLVDGVMKNREKIDNMITPVAPEWPLEQIAIIDRTILRLSIYELIIKREVPPKVAINEAVELAKAFGGENSSKFVNGVLGTVYRNSEYYDPKEDTRGLEDGEHNEFKPESAAAFEEKVDEATEDKKPAKTKKKKK